MPHFRYFKLYRLSGPYQYHCTNDGADIFVRPGPIYGLVGDIFFLVYRNGFWFITNEEFALETQTREKLGPDGKLVPTFEGFMRLKTTGNGGKNMNSP